ncbi:MAG: hypothetical protein FWH12_06365 [Treponema sp.]|nr:hypothetical protein [Treponema sp.]
MVRVETREYYNVWLKQPRGFGRWIFYMGSKDEPHAFTGTYTEAKKQAIAKARELGFRSITVGS